LCLFYAVLVRIADVCQEPRGPEPIILPGHEFEVTCVAFGPNGKELASASYDKTIKIWNPATGKCLKTLSGHKYSVFSLAFHPDGKSIASGGMDKMIRIWDLESCKTVFEITHDVYIFSLSFSPDGKTLASGGLSRKVYLWDVSSGKSSGVLMGHEN